MAKMKIPPTTDYTQLIVAANQPALEDLTFWIFNQGMVFNSIDKWWGDFGIRDFPHEGIDLCLYRNRSGQTRKLGPEIRIPVMSDGVVRAMFTDYLGQAIIVEHESNDLVNNKFLTVYAHTKPMGHICSGLQVSEGDTIATIADTKHSKAKILPHLHLSLAIPATDLVFDNFFWNIMRDPDRIRLLNPMQNVQKL